MLSQSFHSIAMGNDQQVNQAVREFAQYKRQYRDYMGGEAAVALTDCKLAIEGRLRDKWMVAEMDVAVMDDLKPAQKKEELRRRGVPTSEEAKIAAIRQAVKNDPEYLSIWDRVKAVEEDLMTLDEEIASARRKYQTTMQAWRHEQIENMTQLRMGDPTTPVTIDDELAG